MSLSNEYLIQCLSNAVSVLLSSLKPKTREENKKKQKTTNERKISFSLMVLCSCGSTEVGRTESRIMSRPGSHKSKLYYYPSHYALNNARDHFERQSSSWKKSACRAIEHSLIFFLFTGHRSSVCIVFIMCPVQINNVLFFPFFFFFPFLNDKVDTKNVNVDEHKLDSFGIILWNDLYFHGVPHRNSSTWIELVYSTMFVCVSSFVKMACV